MQSQRHDILKNELEKFKELLFLKSEVEKVKDSIKLQFNSQKTLESKLSSELDKKFKD